jgi:hypothetical protein
VVNMMMCVIHNLAAALIGPATRRMMAN